MSQSMQELGGVIRKLNYCSRLSSGNYMLGIKRCVFLFL